MSRMPNPRSGREPVMPADATRIRLGLLIATMIAVAAGWAAMAGAGDPEDQARVRQAISYLDGRQDDWSRFAKAQRGEGADRTTCLSCHTGISYAMARPALGRFAPGPDPAPAERMIAAVRLRVEHWAEL